MYNIFAAYFLFLC